jgi:hypothetical protein
MTRTRLAGEIASLLAGGTALMGGLCLLASMPLIAVLTLLVAMGLVLSSVARLCGVEVRRSSRGVGAKPVSGMEGKRGV